MRTLAQPACCPARCLLQPAVTASVSLACCRDCAGEDVLRSIAHGEVHLWKAERLKAEDREALEARLQKLRG